MKRLLSRRSHAKLLEALLLVWLLDVPGATSMAQAAPAAPGRSLSVESAGQTVAGRVVSAADGHPIPNATVTLTSQQRNGRRQGPPPGQGQTAQTDAEGRYRLPSQPPGKYSLRASAPGYLSTLYLEHEGFSSAILTGVGVPTDDLRFALTPEASLHGRVIDETGEPVRGGVTLYRDSRDERNAGTAGENQAQPIRPAGGTQTDDDGRYEFTNLQPGRYYIAATATPWYAVHARSLPNEAYRTSIDPALDVAYPTTFYPHATNEQGALPIVLKAGGRAAANMLMQAERAVTLTVQMPPGDTSGPNGTPQQFPSLFRKVFGTDQFAGAQVTGRVGDTVSISGIAPGQYTMRSTGRRGPDEPGGTAVNLSAGSATVVMQGTPPATSSDVTVALRTSAGAALPDSVDIELQRIGTPRGGASAAAPGKVEQGTAHFPSVDAGDYRLRLYENGNTWNVSRLSIRGKVVASKVLHLDGSSLQAEVVASAYAPEVDGKVHAADGKVHAGSLVVLVPAGADTGADLFRADQSDLDGSFQFYNVQPGNYLLVAIDNDWTLNWQNAAALMPYLPHALPVTVAASGPRVIALQEAAAVQQK